MALRVRACGPGASCRRAGRCASCSAVAQHGVWCTRCSSACVREVRPLLARCARGATGRGLSPSRPSLSIIQGSGLVYRRARALSSRARAGAFRPSRALHNNIHRQHRRVRATVSRRTLGVIAGRKLRDLFSLRRKGLTGLGSRGRAVMGLAVILVLYLCRVLYFAPTHSIYKVCCDALINKPKPPVCCYTREGDRPTSLCFIDFCLNRSSANSCELFPA